MQRVRRIKDRDENVLTGSATVKVRSKKNFEELMDEGNVREHRVEEVDVMKQEVQTIRKDEKDIQED